MKSLPLLLAFLLSAPAFAGSTRCESSDGRLAYSRTQLDGGAIEMPSYLLELDGRTLLSISPMPRLPVIHDASIAFGAPTGKKTYPVQNHVRVTKSRVPARVTMDADGRVVFSGIVSCTETVHLGI